MISLYFNCSLIHLQPKNADDTIKSLAYRVVDECENDGFAKAIDIILKEKI